MRKLDSHLDFDLEKAKAHSKKNKLSRAQEQEYLKKKGLLTAATGMAGAAFTAYVTAKESAAVAKKVSRVVSKPFGKGKSTGGKSRWGRRGIGGLGRGIGWGGRKALRVLGTPIRLASWAGSTAKKGVVGGAKGVGRGVKGFWEWLPS